MLDQAEYLRWMGSAERTLNSVLGDIERGDYNWACFKAQQAAEAAVKALSHGLGLPSYGHSVSRLIRLLVSKGVEATEDVLRSAMALDKLYVPTRYPNAWTEGMPHEYYSKVDAEEALKHACRIVRWVRRTWSSLESGEG